MKNVIGLVLNEVRADMSERYYYYGYYGNDTSVGPAFWVGGRYHFSDSVSLTMRLGYPDLLTIGVSFFL